MFLSVLNLIILSIWIQTLSKLKNNSELETSNKKIKSFKGMHVIISHLNGE